MHLLLSYRGSPGTFLLDPLTSFHHHHQILQHLMNRHQLQDIQFISASHRLIGIKLVTVPEIRRKLTARECKSAKEENVEKNNKSNHGTDRKPVPPLTTKGAFKFQNSLPYCWCINVCFSVRLQFNTILVQYIPPCKSSSISTTQKLYQKKQDRHDFLFFKLLTTRHDISE